MSTVPRLNTRTRTGGLIKRARKCWQLYLIFLVPLIYILVFKYGPMYGVQIAFKNYTAVKGIWGSPWVGFKYFRRFFESYEFSRVLWNTLSLSVYQLIVGFPIPIILAISLNYTENKGFKSVVQMVTYAPHFISTVVMVGMLLQFLSLRTGLVNRVIGLFGGADINFMGEPGYFKSIYVWSGVWQGMGYSSIIYLSALSGIDPCLHEAAIVDGASKVKRIWHIDLPGILPTIVVLFIMRMGDVLSVGFEKAFLMQNPLNERTSEIVSTYVYKIGLAASIPNYSYATAIGLFISLINFVLIVTVNKIARKISGSALW